jgi:hypothetical protein
VYTYTTNPSSPLQGISARKEDVETMPNIFQPLPWWSDREVSDLPDYVRSIKQEHQYGVTEGRIIRVKKWEILCETPYVIQGLNREYHPSCFLPSTRAEYEAFQQSKNK